VNGTVYDAAVFEWLVWLVPAIVVMAGVARPRGALVALAAALPFFGASRGGPYLGAFDAACLAAILLSLRERRAEPIGLDRAVLAFAAVAVVSFFPLAYHPPSWQPSVLGGLARALGNAPTWSGLFTWRALLDLLLGVGLYFSVRRAYRDRPSRPLALGLAGGLGVLVLLGLAEYAGAIDLGGYRTVAAEGRLHSLFSNSGWLGEYVVVAAPLALAALLSSGPRARRAGLVLLPLSAATLLLSQQRGAWLAVLVQGALGLTLVAPGRWREPGIRRAALALLATTVLGASLLAATRPGLVAGLGDRFTRSDLYLRPHMWRAAAGLFLERPLLGWGIGSFEPALDRAASASPVPAEAHGEAHSTVLQVAAERGLAGLFSLALLALAATLSACEGLRREADRTMAIARALSLAGAATYALVQHVWYPPAVGALVWMVLGSGAVARASRSERLVRRAAPILAVLAALLAAWQVVTVEPLRVPDDRSYGFYRPEPIAGGSMQWTEGHAARRLDCRGQWLSLDLANGHPDPARRPVQLTVRVDGRRVAVRDVPGGWRSSLIPIGDACADGSAVVELIASPTFRPFSDFRRDPALAPSNDERELGLTVRNLRVR
jgi:O-antigen ligase